MHNLLCDKSSSQFPFSALSLAAFLPEPAHIAHEADYCPNAYAEQKAGSENQHVAGSYHGRPAFCAKCTHRPMSAVQITANTPSTITSSRGVE